MFGFGGGDAYNDQPAWGDGEPDDGDHSQAFSALVDWDLSWDEAADVVDELRMVGVSVGEMDEVVSGFGAELTDELMGGSSAVGDVASEFTEGDYDDYTKVFFGQFADGLWDSAGES